MRPSEFAELLEHLADTYPGAVRGFIEAHPLHLMAACAQEVKGFHADAMASVLKHRRMLWLMARGFGKSNLAIYLGAWLAITHPERWHHSIDSVAFFEGAPERVTPANIRIALVSSTQDHAMQLLFSVKSVLQRPILQKTFGSLVGEKRWREKSADTALRSTTRKEPTFSAMGVDSGIAGGHFEVFVADDIYTTQNMRTERSREYTRRTWTETILPTVRPYGRVLVLGTRWARDDLAATIIDQASRGEWDAVVTTPALFEDAQGERHSIWPELWSMKRLTAKKREMGERPFRAQYLMDPSGIGGGMYEEEWLRRHQDVEDLPEFDRRRAVTCIGIDPALSLGERADHTALVAVTQVGQRFYVRECRRGKWTYSQIIQEARELARKYDPVRWIIVESTQGQVALVHEFRRTARDLPARKQDPLRMPGKSKEGRAMQYLKLFEIHEAQPEPRVFFATPTPANGIERLLEELAAFPIERGSDDCVDAMNYAFRGFEISRTRFRKGAW
jgi:phage terminase large subunit-like protein